MLPATDCPCSSSRYVATSLSLPRVPGRIHLDDYFASLSLQLCVQITSVSSSLPEAEALSAVLADEDKASALFEIDFLVDAAL